MRKNDDDNRVRIKVNLKSATNKDEKEREKEREREREKEKEKEKEKESEKESESESEKAKEKNIRCATHEKAKMRNLFEKAKINTINYTDTEIEIKNKNSRKLFTPKIYNRTYLKKKDGSGGGNYLKIKPPSLRNPKQVEKDEKKGEEKDEKKGEEINGKKGEEKNEKREKNEKCDGICQLASLEKIDPNKWIQKIFGDI